MSQRFNWVLLFAVTFRGGHICMAQGADETVYQMSDGVVRPSPLKGASEAYLPIIGMMSHAANLLELPNGDLLCVWYVGTGERDRGVSIALSRLDHGSKRWSIPFVVAHQPGFAEQNPVLFQEPGGKLWLYYTSQKHGSSEATALVYQLSSNDEGHTWTTPSVMFTHPGYYLRQPLIVLSDQWLFPIYQEASGSVSSASAKDDYSIVQVSHDNGKTWSGCDVPGSGGIVQMNIIRPSDAGQLLAFFRSRYADWIYSSHSTDGCHWDAPAATPLPNNNSSIQAVRLKDGHIVIVFNNAQGWPQRGGPGTGSREVLSVALSTDDGRTWPSVRDVQGGVEPPRFFPCEDPEYSYPSIVQSADGKIRIAFTFRRETIKYMTFEESWIKQGTTVGVKEGKAEIY